MQTDPTQRNWRSIARELGCDPDDHGRVLTAMKLDLARRCWANNEAEIELAEIARGVRRSDPAGGPRRPHLARPDPAGDVGQAVMSEGQA